MPAIAKRAEPEKDVIYSFIYEDGKVRSFKFLSYKANATTPTLIMANVTNGATEYTSMTLKRFSFLYSKQLVEERFVGKKLAQKLAEQNAKKQAEEKRQIENDETTEFTKNTSLWLKSFSPEDTEKAIQLFNVNPSEFALKFEKTMLLPDDEINQEELNGVFETLLNLEKEFGYPKKEI